MQVHCPTPFKPGRVLRSSTVVLYSICYHLSFASSLSGGAPALSGPGPRRAPNRFVPIRSALSGFFEEEKRLTKDTASLALISSTTPRVLTRLSLWNIRDFGPE